jgi:predicted Zn-dependent protease
VQDHSWPGVFDHLGFVLQLRHCPFQEQVCTQLGFSSPANVWDIVHYLFCQECGKQIALEM